jgi:hypothetical protein
MFSHHSLLSSSNYYMYIYGETSNRKEETICEKGRRIQEEMLLQKIVTVVINFAFIVWVIPCSKLWISSKGTSVLREWFIICIVTCRHIAK